MARAPKNHCPAGHRYDGSNLYIDPNGKHRCRACSKARHAASNLVEWIKRHQARVGRPTHRQVHGAGRHWVRHVRSTTEASVVTTGKCGHCGKRFAVGHYWTKPPNEHVLLESGVAGVQGNGLNRMIETYCSLYCSKRHKAHTVEEYERFESAQLREAR